MKPREGGEGLPGAMLNRTVVRLGVVVQSSPEEFSVRSRSAQAAYDFLHDWTMVRGNETRGQHHRAWLHAALDEWIAAQQPDPAEPPL